MVFRAKIRSVSLASILAIVATVAALSQEKPLVTVNLKNYGIAADLFADESDSNNEQRALISLFWRGNDRIAVGFSTTPRWSSKNTVQPLHARLVIFDAGGKQLNQRDWDIAADGPAGQTTLLLAPGPDDTILAMHQSTTNSPIPEGDTVQVLKPDASLEQSFYVPATSVALPGSMADSRLVLQTFYADKHASFSWWSGKPLKAVEKLDLPAGARNPLIGPGTAATPICVTADICTGFRVYRQEAAPWTYLSPSLDLQPTAQVFLNPTSLVVVAHDAAANKQRGWLIAHPNSPSTPLPELPNNLELRGVTAIDTNGDRFSFNAGGEKGICGAVSLWCKDISRVMVVDVPSGKIIFQQNTPEGGNATALSSDGKRLAILDRNKLNIYALP